MWFNRHPKLPPALKPTEPKQAFSILVSLEEANQAMNWSLVEEL